MAMRVGVLAAALGVVLTGGLTAAAFARAQSEPPAVNYTPDGKLIFPKDYRSWIYLSSGLDMSYSDRTGDVSQHAFDNVFVDRASYAAYLKTGTWPDKTIFVLEARLGASRGSINKAGVYQTDVAGREAHVKDTTRFKSGWAFFPSNGEAPTSPLAQTSACNRCHEQHAAVDTTFVQFYPTLLPKAVEMKTLSAAYLAEEGAKDEKR